jgi:hypothetical protein
MGRALRNPIWRTDWIMNKNIFVIKKNYNIA